MKGRVCTEISDKNGYLVFLGDTLCFPYSDPMGNLHEDEDFTAIVEFKHGCFGYQTSTHFVPLIEWMHKESGQYVSNQGCAVVYTENYPFWIKGK